FLLTCELIFKPGNSRLNTLDKRLNLALDIVDDRFQLALDRINVRADFADPGLDFTLNRINPGFQLAKTGFHQLTGLGYPVLNRLKSGAGRFKATLEDVFNGGKGVRKGADLLLGLAGRIVG